jgi:hypothetical protein
MVTLPGFIPGCWRRAACWRASSAPAHLPSWPIPLMVNLWLLRLGASWTVRRHHDPDAARPFRDHHGRQLLAWHIYPAVRPDPSPPSNQRLSSIYGGVLPFVVINFATPMVISYVPAIAPAVNANSAAHTFMVNTRATHLFSCRLPKPRERFSGSRIILATGRYPPPPRAVGQSEAQLTITSIAPHFVSAAGRTARTKRAEACSVTLGPSRFVYSTSACPRTPRRVPHRPFRGPSQGQQCAGPKLVPPCADKVTTSTCGSGRQLR